MYYYKLYDWTLKTDLKICFLEEQNIINNILEIKFIDIPSIKFTKKKNITDISNEQICIYDTSLGYLIEFYDNCIIVSSECIYFQINNQIDMQIEILMTLGLTLLFIDRRVIPFHGASIFINGKLTIISAGSNSGKSTLTYKLLEKGYKLCADDLVPIEINEKGCYGILSNYSFIKLWNDTIYKFNIRNEKAEIIYKTGKYRVSLNKKNIFNSINKIKISEIIVLNTHYDIDGIEERELAGIEKLINLFDLTHGSFLFKELLSSNLIKHLIYIKNNIKITEFKYKKNYKNLDLLVKKIAERGSNGKKIQN